MNKIYGEQSLFSAHFHFKKQKISKRTYCLSDYFLDHNSGKYFLAQYGVLICYEFKESKWKIATDLPISMKNIEYDSFDEVIAKFKNSNLKEFKKNFKEWEEKQIAVRI